MQPSLWGELDEAHQSERHEGPDRWREQRFVWNLDQGELRRHDVASQQRPRLRPSRVQELRGDPPLRRSSSLQEALSPSLDYHVSHTWHEREHHSPVVFRGREQSHRVREVHYPLRRHGSWPRDVGVARRDASWNEKDHEEYKQSPPPQVPQLSSSPVPLYSHNAAVRHSFDSLEANPSRFQVEAVPSPRLRSASASSNEFGDGSISSFIDDDTKLVSVDGAGWSGSTETYIGEQATASPPTAPVKRPRYLRELDRRIILARLDRGEKQAALAKEYKVSRSTICNLYKQRDVVLSRKDENPMSRHPKKSRLQQQQHKQHQEQVAVAHSGAASPSESSGTSPGAREPEPAHKNTVEVRHPEQARLPVDMLSFDRHNVVEIKSRAIALLLTTIQAQDTSATDFHRCCSRLIRLFVEESLATISSREWAATSLHGTHHPPMAPSNQPLCVVTLEQQCTLMLDAFHLIDPRITEGFVRTRGDVRHRSVLALEGAHLPPSLRGYDVVLLDVVLESGDFACNGIAKVLARGADAARITLVTLFISAEVVALVQYLHPRVRILATTIDPQAPQPRDGATTPASPGQLFFERFSRTYL